ncbi:MAG TPA: DUF917 domain-containing protein, partial [Lautropia sp.]|nr:DUF917 domain-containing protein [Lautropia sp.]
GALGLASSPAPMIQAAAGGNRSQNAYMELVVEGATAKVSPVIRRAADMAGGFIASCRNPVKASYVREHAALGGISKALALGEAILAAESRGGSAVVDAITKTAEGAIIGSGKVSANSLKYTSEAYDIGVVEVGSGAGRRLLHVMNEYMAVEDGEGGRLATYPDVITTLDPEGRPVSAGSLKIGMEVLILHVPKERLPLSSSVKDPSVYPVVEKALGLKIADYARGSAS